MMNLQDRDKQFATITTLSESEIHRPNVVLSLACCPVDTEVNSTICSKKDVSASTSPSYGLGCKNQFAADRAREHTVNEAMKGEFCTQEEQDGDVGRAMMEEFTSSVVGLSEKGRDPKPEKMERGLRVVARSNGESNGCGNLRRYLMSMEHAGKLPSSQYKGVVPQPNGRWGAQIYEKHQRVWLGTFNREEDAARAYDRAALKFRGREAIINFCPGRGGDLEEGFMREFNKETIVDMLRKHTYDEELEYHGKRIMMAAARSVAMKNAEASGSEGSGRREIFCQEDQAASDGNPNAVTSGTAMAGLSREHLFDKAVTPSDVGKLNRMVIPKNHAEKYFPVDVNTHDKGFLLSFEDDTGKVWRFRYSYWKSSQSYVLTKGWSRFVKEKKLEAGDIVSFHREVARPSKFYISWRRKSLRQLRLADGPPSHQSKGAWRYPSSILSSLNPFDSGAQASVVYNAQRMPPLNKRVGHVVAERSQSPATRPNGVFPFYCSEPPTKPTYKSSFYDINQNLHSSLKSGDECAKIRSLYPLVNPPRPPAVQELATLEHKAASSVHPTAKKGVRLFGMTLVEP